MTYADMGQPAEARALYSELVARSAHQYVQPCILAMAASATGEHEAAIGFARQAVDERDGLFALLALNYPTSIACAPILATQGFSWTSASPPLRGGREKSNPGVA